MYISTSNHSSRNLLQTNHISQNPFSFADHTNQYLTSTNPIKRLSSEVHSFPLNYHLSTPTKIQDQNNFNSGYMNEISKIQQINHRISRTTDQILHNKQKYRLSENDHHKVLSKQPEEKKRKYFRQFVKYQPETGSLSKYNCGTEPIVVKTELMDQQSEGKRSRKSSVKINFLYENSPERKETFQNKMQSIQTLEHHNSVKSPRSSLNLSPSYNYHSTDLILTKSSNPIRKNSFSKDVNFIYQPTSKYDMNEYNPNSRSSMSAYELAKYSPRSKEEKQPEKDITFNKTTQKYLPSEYLPKNNSYTETSSSKSKQLFYEMSQSPKMQKSAQKQESTKGSSLSSNQIKESAKTTSNISKTVSQLKDKESKMIAILLIILAMMIFIMQLFS